VSPPGIVVMVRYVAQAGQEQVAAQEISALVATVLAKERECGGIMIVRQADEGARITLIEHWPSRQAFIGRHMQQPHVQSFIRRAGAFLDGPPEIAFCNRIDNV